MDHSIAYRCTKGFHSYLLFFANQVLKHHDFLKSGVKNILRKQDLLIKQMNCEAYLPLLKDAEEKTTKKAEVEPQV